MNNTDSLLHPTQKQGGLSSARMIFFLVLVLAIFLFIATTYTLISPPKNFPNSQLFEVRQGATLGQVATELKVRNYISSEIFFKIIARIGKYDRNIVTGYYRFSEPVDQVTLLKKLTSGERGIREIRVTIPEGLTRVEIAERFSKELPEFDTQDFLKVSDKDEGYMFPDTYFFYENATATVVYNEMLNNFKKQIATIKSLSTSTDYSLHELLTLASIVEEEAVTTEDRKLVAGILFNRLKINMPLQVDAAFQYINGKGSLELTQSDLLIDSPYNTYRNKGLPPTPIANPGLDSIIAVLEPTASDYYYYLSDSEGKIYYSKTFEQHKLNKAKYLR